MSFYIFKLKFLLKVISHKFFIHTVLASIHIGRDEPTLGESMDTDMTLCYENESAPSARVFDMVVRRGENYRFHKRTHAKRIAKLREAGKDSFFAIKALRIPTVTVDGNMLAKMGPHRIYSSTKRKNRRQRVCIAADQIKLSQLGRNVVSQ